MMNNSSNVRPADVRQQRSHAGAHFSAYAKDALHKALMRRTINLPADEQICDILVKKNRMELMMPMMFLFMPAITCFMWASMNFFSYLGNPAKWPPWWVWVLGVALAFLPYMLRNYFKQFYGFTLWIFTDKALHRVSLGRQIGANLNPPVTAWKYADMKASYWSMIWPGSVLKGKGILVLRMDFQNPREEIRLQVNGGLTHVRHLIDSLLHYTRPPQVQLAEYMNLLHLPYDPSSQRREYPTSSEVLTKIFAKRRRVILWAPIIVGLLLLIMWFMGQLPAPANFFAWIYGGMCLIIPIGLPIDLIRRTKNFANMQSHLIRITDNGIELPANDHQAVTRIEFSTDWFFALFNTIITLSLKWDAMDAVEIYKLDQPVKTPLLKLGLLNPQDHKQFFFTLLQVYFAWLERTQPDYFLSPEQLRDSFIGEHPFHQELMGLVEARVQAYQQNMASARNGLYEKSYAPKPESLLGLNRQAGIPPQLLPLTRENIPNVPEVGYIPEMGPLRYPLLTYSPYFADDERVLSVYHPPHPARAFTEMTHMIFLVLFVGSAIVPLIVNTYFHNSAVDILGMIFPMIFGMFWICFLLASIGEYWAQLHMEFVLTTQKIYWQAGGTIKLVPYANIQEVTRIRLNKKTDEYLKIRFVFKKPAAQFPGLLHYVPRASALFAVLSQYGVSLVEE